MIRLILHLIEFQKLEVHDCIEILRRRRKKNSETAIDKYGVEESVFVIRGVFIICAKICAREFHRVERSTRGGRWKLRECQEFPRLFRISAFVVTLIQTFPRVHSRPRVTRCFWSFNPFQGMYSIFLFAILEDIFWTMDCISRVLQINLS